MSLCYPAVARCTSMTRWVAAKHGIDDVHAGCRDKATAVRTFADRHGVDLADVCFMGDDVNDLPAMEIVGVSAAPANAHSAVLGRVSVITVRHGGNGAVRELIDHLVAQGLATIDYGFPNPPR